MRCPNCRQPLLTTEIEGVELDYCAVDLGIWLDEGELESLFHSATPVLQVQGSDRKGKRRCPRCDAKMLVHHPAPALELDLCPYGDGIWFDHGEVLQLARAIEQQGQAGISPHLNEIFGELKRLLGGTS